MNVASRLARIVALSFALLFLGSSVGGSGHLSSPATPHARLQAADPRTFADGCGASRCATAPRPVVSGPTLSGVGVDPSTGATTIGQTLSLAPIPTCTGGPCPSGVTYNWSLTRAVGDLSYTSSNTEVASIVSGGDIPAGIAYDPDDGDLYVTNDNVLNRTAISNVTVISGATDAVVGSIPVGASPSGIAFDPADGDLYVTNCGSDNMSVISGESNTVVASISMTLSGCEIGAKMYMNFAPVAFDPANDEIYASNYLPGTVSAINTTSNSVVQSIVVGGLPWGLAYDPDDEDMYATETTVAQVAAVDSRTNQVVAHIPVGLFPSGITFDSANGELYVADSGNWVHNPVGFGNISVINGSSNVLEDTIFVEGYPWSVVYDPANNCVYETDSNTSVMRVISGTTNSVVGRIPIGGVIQGTSTDFAEAYDPGNGRVYVTGLQFDTVSAIGGASDAVVFSGGAVPGNTTLFVNATWEGLTVQSEPVPITVDGSSVPVLVSLSETASPLHVGSTSYLVVDAVGGTGPLEYAYTGLPVGCHSLDAPSLACAPLAPGSYRVRAYVNDTDGHSTNATLELFVVESPPSAPAPPPPLTLTPIHFSGGPGATALILATVLAMAVVAFFLVAQAGWRFQRTPAPPPGASDSPPKRGPTL